MLSTPSRLLSTGRRSCSKRSWLAVAVLAMSWASIASANIVFIGFPQNTTVKPGASLEVIWRIQPPAVGAPENSEPFDLVLRAFTGQGYSIQKGVRQSALKLSVQIPAEATGGKHSFYAFHQGGVKAVASNQFVIEGLEVFTTSAPAATSTNADPSATLPAAKPSEDTGLSGGALAGIIGGAVVLLLLVALIFFFRNRRRVAEAKENNGSSMDDHKERGFTSGPDAYSSKNQDKESLTRSAGSGGGPHFDDGMVAVPLHGSGPRSPRGDDPRAQHQQHQHQHQHQHPHPQQEQMHQLLHPRSPTKNPFDAPPPGTSPRLQQYQPPQPPPHGGMPNPLMAPPVHAHQQQQLQRGPSPYHQSSRDSFESEIESAYDPAHTRMMNNNGNNGMPMQGMPPMHGSPSLSHSPSGRSTNSSRYPQNMSPQPAFANQHDREIMAAAAAVAAAASPVQGHRQLQQQQPPQSALGQQQGLQHPANKGPMTRSTSPRTKEIEMQPLDIQQHHFEQQQKMLMRQKQQQQQQMEMQQQQQRSAQSTPVPLPAAQKSINPTQFDDKAEVEENDEENVPVYNGYRDTIFGAYAQNQDDDEEEDEEPATAPVPALPASILVQNATASNSSQEPSSSMTTGGVQIQRKKSVKFTGVPSTGPIVLPNQEAAKEHQQQRQQKKRQELEDQRPVSEAYTEDYGEDYEDEDDIRNRLMEIEAEAVSPIPSHASSRPQINTSAGPAGQEANVLSPVRSPDQGSPSYPTQGYVAPPLATSSQQQQRPFQQPPSGAEGSPSLNSVSAFGNGFYEDVLAAVEKKHVPASPTSTSGSVASPTSPRSQQHHQQQQQQQQQQQEFKKPVMPPVPRSESPPPPQQYVQQQHIPAPQPQHMGPVAQEVFGAPSPRIAPAVAKTNNINHSNGNGSYTSPLASATASTAPAPLTSRPDLSPRSNARPAMGSGPGQQQQQQSNDEFYENSLL
ncbi:hypothetical protein BGZ70_007671 [Mortierella alpina]|uniref:Uncharacterized protein n=1 Tax=Mortierella alpina TaxID=64518 RepID=A0A9P6JF91_MORAP|nr:hypothetical protein BGZ70_007671 [Mortierella alpina]